MIIVDKIKRFKYQTTARIHTLLPKIKPAAICIGAQKAGTTALYKYLSIHPRVAISHVKEIDFFNCNSRYSKGLVFYHSHFPNKTLHNRGKLSVDITPGYMAGAKKAAPRIYEYNRGQKIIVLLRNPVSRAYSAWQMYRKYYDRDRSWFFKWLKRCDKNIDHRSFLKRPPCFGKNFEKDVKIEIDAIKNGAAIEMPILELGLYQKHLANYFELFPRTQILIISSSKMKHRTASQLKKIEDFLGLENHTWNQKDLKPRFVGGYKNKPPTEASYLLNSFYEKPNQDLFEMIDKQLIWK